MVKLIVMVGLPASGKSTIAKEVAELEDGVVLSSDELRLELFGSYNIQDKNDELFKELNKRMISNLRKDITVVYDATNLSSKRRKALFNNIPSDVFRKIIVVSTPIDECIERDSIREKKVGVRIILGMVSKFQFPLESEGYDELVTIDNSNSSAEENMVKYEQIIEESDSFDQKNKHHKHMLSAHCRLSARLYIDREIKNMNNDIYTALEYHDYGKLYCHSSLDRNGKITDELHYYGHENVSAYLYLSLKETVSFHVVRLINYHMLPNQKEINHKKLLDKLGEKVYNDIMIVNKYDRLAH